MVASHRTHQEKKQPPTWLSFGGPTLYYVYIYIYIWLWVKTLAPSDPEDSWDLWMFIPRLAMLEKSRWAMFPGEPPPCFVLPPSVYSMEKPTSSWQKSLLVHKKSVMFCCCFIYLPFILVMSWFVMICCLFFEICSI